MKRLMTIPVMLLVLPLFATEPEDPKTKEKASSEQVDSPLVAAAKKSRRGTAKMVITDETVKTAEGRITTTSSRRVPVVPPPAPSLEVETYIKRDKEAAQRVEKAAEEKKKEEERQKRLDRLARAAAQAEAAQEGLSEIDSEAAEKELRDAAAAAQDKKP